jgi:hypothetical protein
MIRSQYSYRFSSKLVMCTCIQYMARLSHIIHALYSVQTCERCGRYINIHEVSWFCSDCWQTSLTRPSTPMIGPVDFCQCKHTLACVKNGANGNRLHSRHTNFPYLDCAKQLTCPPGMSCAIINETLSTDLRQADDNILVRRLTADMW